MLKIKDININYGKRVVLKDISLEFMPQKLYGIIGPNGAGKSTLLNIISRELEMKSGEIYINGSSIKEYSQKQMARKLSYMRQSITVKFPFTVKELVSMGRYCHDNVPKKENEMIINERILENDLEDYGDRPVTELSGGEVQRAIFAKIIAQDSQIILVDEGLSNADIFYKVKFFEQLRNEVSRGKLVIMVIHDLFLARKFCDELVVLDKQGIYGFGKSDEVLNRQTLKDVFRVNGDFRINKIWR